MSGADCNTVNKFLCFENEIIFFTWSFLKIYHF